MNEISKQQDMPSKSNCDTVTMPSVSTPQETMTNIDSTPIKNPLMTQTPHGIPVPVIEDLSPEVVKLGWKKCWSKRQNRPYFANRLLGISMWKRPSCIQQAGGAQLGWKNPDSKCKTSARNMTDTVSIKAYLKCGRREVEVRRFSIDGGAATNCTYLRGKIQALFPSIQNHQFTIFRQDKDNTYIMIDSDEALVAALTLLSEPCEPLKLFIQIKAPQQQSPGVGAKQTHAGVTCDRCEGAVIGFRYKCVTCPDFNLCSYCEAKGLHPEHCMLRLPTPISASNFSLRLVRKVYHPLKSTHKKHGWKRKADMHGWPHLGDLREELQSTRGASHCKFTRQENLEPRVTNIFDFSALFNNLETINTRNNKQSRVNTAGEIEIQESDDNVQAQPCQTTSSQESNQSSSQAQIGTIPKSKLNKIGSAITALLGPIGIDLTFNVQQKSTSIQKTATPSATLQQNTSALPQQQITGATSDQSELTTPLKNNTTTESSALFVDPQTESICIPAPEASVETEESSSITSCSNSDDWTLIDRESPISGDVVAMDVDESLAARSKSIYPELPKEAPSVPP